MITITRPTATELLVELERLGVTATVRGDRISLRPASIVPAELLAAVREQKSALMAVLADPQARWQSQAEVLVADLDGDRRADLLELFTEREAIASVDGGVDEDTAGHMAYQWLLTRLGKGPIRANLTEGT